jgi:hypothetical protein
MGGGGAPCPVIERIAAFKRNMATAIVPLCQHWMDNATRCASPAMRGTRYCYSHHLQQARGARRNAERTRQRWFESAPLQDTASVQRALAEVMTRLISGNIGHKRAGQILYKLQTASMTLRSVGCGLEKIADEEQRSKGKSSSLQPGPESSSLYQRNVGKQKRGEQHTD